MAHMQYMHRGGVPLHSSGSIHVVCGPMFSGKTTELLRRMKRFSLAKRRCMLIKYANDNRYSLDGVVTHDMQQSAAVACSRLAEVADKAADFEVLGIDEGQFFPDVVEFSERMANEGKTVIVAALDGTFQRKAFGPILDLIPLAESVIKLSAVCMLCHREAAFSKRIGSETEIEVIGGADKYIAVCRECYHSDGKKRNGKKKQQQQQQQQSGDTTCVQGTKSEDMHARVNDSLESTTTESEGGDADDEHTHDDGSESDSASSDGFSGTASPTDATPSKKKEFHPRSTRSLFTATRN